MNTLREARPRHKLLSLSYLFSFFVEHAESGTSGKRTQINNGISLSSQLLNGNALINDCQV